MKTLFFKGEIEDNGISDLILSIEEYKTEPIRIYMSSSGGYDQTSNLFINYIENNPDINLELIFHWNLHSACFDMVSQLKCKRTVLNGTYAIIHLYAMDFNTRENKELNKFLQKGLDKANERVLKQYRNFLTDNEFERLKNMEDIYLCDERLRLIFS